MKKFEARCYHKKQEWHADHEIQMGEIITLIAQFEELDRDYEIKREWSEGKVYYTVVEVMT